MKQEETFLKLELRIWNLERRIWKEEFGNKLSNSQTLKLLHPPLQPVISNSKHFPSHIHFILQVVPELVPYLRAVADGRNISVALEFPVVKLHHIFPDRTLERGCTRYIGKSGFFETRNSPVHMFRTRDQQQRPACTFNLPPLRQVKRLLTRVSPLVFKRNSFLAYAHHLELLCKHER